MMPRRSVRRAIVLVGLAFVVGCGEDLTLTADPDGCGDGVPESDLEGGPGAEECDDGNGRDGDGCSAECLLEPRLIDFSDFETFEFARESPLGFCPPVGALLRARVSIHATGSGTLRGSILRDDSRCEPFFVDSDCLDLDDFVRPLTVEEEAEVRDAVRAVAVYEQRPNGCDTIVFDPCLVNAFGWDGFRASDFECHAPKLPAAEVNRLVRLLEDLASRS